MIYKERWSVFNGDMRNDVINMSQAWEPSRAQGLSLGNILIKGPFKYLNYRFFHRFKFSTSTCEIPILSYTDILRRCPFEQNLHI